MTGVSPAGPTVGYCTNVHPAEDLPGLLAQLGESAGPIRERLGVRELDVGLWLPAGVAAELATDSTARARLKQTLTANGLTVRTLNAFPHGEFHADVVKKAVYAPRWGDPARTTFTMHCAEVLADLLPAGGVGSISTLPLGWREDWTATDDAAAERELASMGAFLADLYARTSRRIRLAIEPEPGCVLDTIADVVAWLGPRTAAGVLDAAYIGVCLDTCHLAVSFADPATEIASVRAAGLQIVKVQASAAPEVPDPSDPAQRALIGRFVEPRYLHQTRELTADGSVLAVDDLDEALADLPGAGPWRVHFHIPIHADPEPPLRSTRGVILECLAALGEQAYDLEVETYTWAVLPPETAGVDLVTGITGELRWLMEATLRAGGKD